MECLMCDIIKSREHDPYFIAELETGYAVLGWYQKFKGCTLFVCKTHAVELHELESAYRTKFLEEMALVAQAVFQVFQPDKMNYELIGNGVPHLHWYLFPRRAGDSPYGGPVWRMPKEEMYADAVRPGENERKNMIAQIRAEIFRLRDNA